MEATELHQIRQLRLASLGPMMNMVCVDVPRVRTTRESATSIACVERTANRRWNATRLAPDIERLASLIFYHADDTGITGQATHRLYSERRPVLQLATSRPTRSQSLGIDVHNDLLAISRAQGLRSVLQETLGDSPQGIGAPGTPRRSLIGRLNNQAKLRLLCGSFRGNAFCHRIVHGCIECLDHQRTHFGRQPALQNQGAVFVVEIGHAAGGLLPRLTRELLRLRCTTIVAHQLLHMVGGTVQGDAEEILFGLRADNTRQRSRFGVAKFPSRHRRGDPRQLVQRVRYADLLTRGPKIDAALPIKPMRT